MTADPLTVFPFTDSSNTHYIVKNQIVKSYNE